MLWILYQYSVRRDDRNRIKPVFRHSLPEQNNTRHDGPSAYGQRKGGQEELAEKEIALAAAKAELEQKTEKLAVVDVELAAVKAREKCCIL